MKQNTAYDQDPQRDPIKGLLDRTLAVDERSIDWGLIERNVMSELGPDVSPVRRVAREKPSFSLSGLLTALWNPPVLAGALACCIGAVMVIGYLRGDVPQRGDVVVLGASGDVRVHRAGAMFLFRDGWRQARESDPIRAGASVAVGEGGVLMARVSEGTGFALTAGSSIRIGTAGVQTRHLDLDKGDISMIVRKRAPGQTFSIRTPNAVCEVLGTAFTVAVSGDSGGEKITRVTVMRGSVRISDRNNLGVYAVAQASETVVMRGDTLLAPVHANVPGVEDDIADDLLVRELNTMLAAGMIRDTMMNDFARYQSTLTPPVPVVTPNVIPVSGLDAVRPEIRMPEVALGDSARTIQTDPVLPLVEPAPKKPGLVAPASDRRRVAGQLCGIRLYWDNSKKSLDTIGFAAACAPMVAILSDTCVTPSHVQHLASSVGMRFVRIRNTTATGLVILKRLKHPVIVLTQWSSDVDVSQQNRVITNGSDQAIVLSDYVWEQLGEVKVIGKSKADVALSKVHASFSRAGYSLFEPNRSVFFYQVDILGTMGFAIEDKRDSYITKQNISRTIIDAYCIIDKNLPIPALTRQVESAMDKMKLDLSYRAPEFVEVK